MNKKEKCSRIDKISVLPWGSRCWWGYLTFFCLFGCACLVALCILVFNHQNESLLVCGILMLVFSLYGAWVYLKKWLFEHTKYIWFASFSQDSVFCYNRAGKMIASFPKKKILTIYVVQITYEVKSAGTGATHIYTPVKHRYISLMFDSSRPCRNMAGEYTPEETLTEHYMLIAYTPETLEILKKHLDVPVIVEEEE